MSNQNNNLEELDVIAIAGLYDAYEHVLKKICGDGMPVEGCYDLCAVYLLEYEKTLLDDNIRRNNLKRLLEIDAKAKSQQTDELNKDNSALNEIFPRNKLNLQTTELLKIDKQVTLDNPKLYKKQLADIINNKIVFTTNKTEHDNNLMTNSSTLNEYIETANGELMSKLIKTGSNKVNFSLEFINKEQDIVNHSISKVMMD